MTKDEKMKVSFIAPASLIPYSNNARTHSEDQIKQIMASIEEFGFTNPILIDEDKNIIAGHGRLIAAQALKMKKVPTVCLSGLSDIQKKAYIIADNKLALNAGWDFDLLRMDLEEIKTFDFDLNITGFDIDELNSILDIEGEFPPLKEEKEPFRQMTFILHDDQQEIVQAALDGVLKISDADQELNVNSNANKLTAICRHFLDLDENESPEDES